MATTEPTASTPAPIARVVDATTQLTDVIVHLGMVFKQVAAVTNTLNDLIEQHYRAFPAAREDVKLGNADIDAADETGEPAA